MSDHSLAMTCVPPPDGFVGKEEAGGETAEMTTTSVEERQSDI